MLEINSKGKELNKEGRALVDGIQTETAGMLSTVNSELSCFIDPDLTWNNIKKGFRSTTRRSRNFLNQKLSQGAGSGYENCKRDQDSSESEKLGVAVLGRRFAEKIVNVPVKKRRLRTLSPDHEGTLSPQSQTQCRIESEQLIDIKPSVAQGFHHNSKNWVSDESVEPKCEGKVDEVPYGKKYETLKSGYANDDDFSGIELLAAAACSGSIDNDVKLEETSVSKAFPKAEAVDSPIATLPFKESIASSVTSHFSGRELVNEDDMGDSVVDKTTIAAVSKNENGVVARNRAHWDLNTVMEAWEEPDDVTPVDSQANYSESVPGGPHFVKINIGNSAIQSNLDVLRDGAKRDGQSVVCKEMPSDVGCIKELADGIGVAVGRSCKEKDTLKTLSSPNGTCIEKQYCTTEQVKEALSVSVYDTVAYLPLTSMKASGDHLCPELQHTASFHVLEEKMHASNCELEQVGEVSSGTSVVGKRKLSSEYLEVGKHEISAPNLPLLNSIGCVINETIKYRNFFENTTRSLDSKTSPGQAISRVTSKTSDVGNYMGELCRANHIHPSPKSEALSASSTSVVVGEVKLLSNKASATDNNEIDVALKDGPKGLWDLSDCPSRRDQDKNISDCYDSYAAKDGKKADMEHISECEAGYDSSFEDGELREPGVYTWEENGLEGETECVDYGSEYGEGDDYDTFNKSAKAENAPDGYQGYRKGSLLGNNDIGKVVSGDNRLAVAVDSKPLEQCFNGRLLDGSHLACTKAKISGGNQFNEHMGYGVAEGKVDGYDDNSLYAGEFRSSVFRGNLSSFSKGSLPFDAVERKTYPGVHKSRFDYSNYSYPRAERGFGLEKSMGRARVSCKPFFNRNETDSQWDNCLTSYRDTRNRYAHNYHGPEGHAYSRPRDSTAFFATKFGACNFEDDRRSIINSSNNGRYRSSMGRRSPADREDSCVGQRGIPPVRGIDQDRSRGRLGQYARGIRRVPQAEYSEDIPDDDAPRPIHRQPYFSRRERGCSPNYGGGNFLRRKSCPRSPTHSPVAWNSQRDRNMNTRRRSPDFRSDARRERIRSPLQKNNYGAEKEEIYMSPPRSRVCPLSNSRRFNDRNYTDNHFRDRRSPVRMFRGRQRMDSIGYFGKRSDGIHRPNICRGRFQQVSSTRREPELEVKVDEKSNHDDGYEMNHQARRYDSGGAVKRFRFDANGCFEACNAHNDDNSGCPIKRDIPQNEVREERGSRFNSGDGMYANASSAGQKDLNEDAANREE